MALVLGLHQSPVGNFAGSNPVLVMSFLVLFFTPSHVCYFGVGWFSICSLFSISFTTFFFMLNSAPCVLALDLLV